jgi:hypothetical protein
VADWFVQNVAAPGTTHSFVGAGDGLCVMVTVGRRLLAR